MNQYITSVATQIANTLNQPIQRIEKALQLLDNGYTAQFLAKYRQDAIDGMSAIELNSILQVQFELKQLTAKRLIVEEALKSQGVLTKDLEQLLFSVSSKAELDDIAASYYPKRSPRLKAALDAGLDALVTVLFTDGTISSIEHASRFVSEEHGIITAEAALEGAQQIVYDKFLHDWQLNARLRSVIWEHGTLIVTKANASKKMLKTRQKNSMHQYAEYLNVDIPVKNLSAHRAALLFRGRQEGLIQLKWQTPKEVIFACYQEYLQPYATLPTYAWLMNIAQLVGKNKTLAKLELEGLARLRQLADSESMRVLSNHLRDALLAPPAGPSVTLGLDTSTPHLGVKAAVVDANGVFLGGEVVFLRGMYADWYGAMASLAKLIIRLNVQAISIGSGYGSRDVELLVQDILHMYSDLSVVKHCVSAVGAAVYAESSLAATECVDVDISLRSAVSIARRLQDPLAELVKIDPQQLKVGSVTYDGNAASLVQNLHRVVQDCVSMVRVNVNTASVALLAQVPGLNAELAANLVNFRNAKGLFLNRNQLQQIPGFNAQVFEQAAGFLCIIAGENPLDATAVHPEAYALVAKILADHNLDLMQVLGNARLRSVDPLAYVSEKFDVIYIRNVLNSLETAYTDPRQRVTTAKIKRKEPLLKNSRGSRETSKVVNSAHKAKSPVVKQEKAPKTLFNTAMADALSKLKRVAE